MAQHRLIVSVVAAFSCSVGADVVFVDDNNCPGPGSGTELDPFCSIQTAIDAAVDTDEIVVAPGTYFETINFLGKAIWLHSSDGAEVTTIDGTGNLHVVQCVNGEGSDTVLSGFVITGGNADDFPSDDHGGGMYNSRSSPTVLNCSFIGNTASNLGGGMYNRDGSPTVNNCTFSGNTASLGGGMFNNNSNPTVSNCVFIGNTATASSGGGMANIGGSSPTVSNCVFIGNTAGNNGGGMANFGTGDSPTVTNCTFSGNTADFGAAMIIAGGSPIVTSCTLWGDSPNEIFNAGGAPTVAYCNIEGGYTGTGNIDADPLFVDPGSGDYHLSPGSPCIDAGNNNAVPAGITTDLDGNPRFVDDPDTVDTGLGDPPVVDMGAYEFQGTSCPWDCDGGESTDGTVGITDFLLLLAQWGSPGSCDFDGGGVGITDFLALLANWGPCP